jgi:hypothetical protein
MHGKENKLSFQELSLLPEKYRNGKHEEVWKLISFLDLEDIGSDGRACVNEIITETFSRVEFNFHLVFGILDKHGFEQINYFPDTLMGENMVIGDKENWIEKADWFYSDKSQPLKIPWSLAAFFTWFKLVDFRGELTDNEVDFLKDPFYMESFDDLELLTSLASDIDYGLEEKVGMMFTPDEFHKENISGARGPEILLSRQILVDNYVFGFTDDMELTFIDYLRFNFEWACFPGLAWCDADERKPYDLILREVASNLKPF